MGYGLVDVDLPQVSISCYDIYIIIKPEWNRERYELE